MRPQRREAVGLGAEGIGALRRPFFEKTASQK